MPYEGLFLVSVSIVSATLLIYALISPPMWWKRRRRFRRLRGDILVGAGPSSTETSADRVAEEAPQAPTLSHAGCSVCGLPSDFADLGGPVKCRNLRCTRWYHTECLLWFKRQGRKRCSCGSELQK